MTQPIEPERHTVEYYVGLLSRPDIVEKRAYALRLISSLAYREHIDESERLRRIANLVAAAEQVTKPEVEHSQACLDQLEERPCRFDCPVRRAAEGR